MKSSFHATAAIYVCCLGVAVSCVAQSPGSKQEPIEVRKCSDKAIADVGYCLFEYRDGSALPILALDEGDESAKVIAKEIGSTQAGQEYVLVEFAFEPDEDIPSYKDVLFQRQGVRLVPLVIAHSWDSARIVDANGDGTLDIELYQNPFNVRDSRWPKWPLILDGNNPLRPVRFVEAARHIRAHLTRVEAAATRQEAECHQVASSCGGRDDIQALRQQAAEMERQLVPNM